MTLIQRDESVLLIVDTQEGFYRADRVDVDRPPFHQFIDRVAWVAMVANGLDVPIVVAEEDPDQNGPTSPRVVAQLPEATPILAKSIFAMPDNPEIKKAIDATRRPTCVVVGMETDVCVAHTALRLLDMSKHVVAVSDAVFSPNNAHEHGLRRLQSGGVELLSAKELFYDWTRGLDNVHELHERIPSIGEAPGFHL